MATREKKLSIARKQNTSSPVPPKEDETLTEETASKSDTTPADEAQQSPKAPASKQSLVKKLTAAKKRKLKPTIAIKLKPKIKKSAKISKQKLINSLKNAEVKKTFLKQFTAKKPATKIAKNVDKEENLPPPVLEPIFPIGDNVDNKPANKKKGAAKPPKIDNYSKKVENSDSLSEQNKPKRVYKRKVKPDNNQSGESIEDVMNDLSSLIKSGDIKQEPEVLSESSKSDTNKTEAAKSKKIIKRKKKENIENTLRKLSPSQRKIIDMLDLNVSKFKQGIPGVDKRRHSIEKFPVGTLDTETSLNSASVFNNLPRSLSPRSKTQPKIRPSIEGFNRRANPYKTRSDSPARILRNGKHRKLKDLELLEGLDITTKRRKQKNCSDFSGSEMSLSKFSGYESDSSFSDLSSLHGAENTENTNVDNSIKSELKDNESEIKTEAVINGQADNNVDTNSNVCKENIEVKAENIATSPSIKVPEKSIILDIMKQTFNDTIEEKAKKKLEPKREDDEQIESQNDKVIPEIVNEEPPPEGNSSRENNITTNGADEESALPNGDPVPRVLEESPEDLVIKENILQALGLQSLKAAKEAKLKKQEKSELRTDSYTGTLKTVIKISRSDKKKGRNTHMKLAFNKSKPKNTSSEFDFHDDGVKDGPSTSSKHSGQSSDTAGAHRKSHYSNRSNMDGSSEHTSDGETGTQEGKSLVIPEKASSFSIHPGRLCKDECSYCFGKFGLFDTPCHIAQMKSVDRQRKILATERHLTCDSCLCDACYRHVDRKANTPSYTNKSYKRSAMVAPGPRQDHCHVLGCCRIATNILRRKWIIKMRKSICEVINIDLDNPGLHSIPICDDHYSALEHLMVCAICKRRLAKNHVHYLGPETAELNQALNSEGVPLQLSDKPVVCKLCKFFAAIILKPADERPENSITFYKEYKKRLLHFNDIVPMDEAAAEEPIIIPTKDRPPEPLKKKRKLSKNQNLHPGDFNSSDSQMEQEKSDQSHVPSSDSTNQSRPESPSDYMVDYNTLIPSIAMDCGSDSESNSRNKETTIKPIKKIPRPETVKQAVEISKKLKSDKNSDIAVQRLGSNPSISVRQLFPCEEDLPLQGHIEFGNVKERTPEGWEKCTAIIQYDMETKHLWQELQKPYGNQSSFLRHLILLEKYFRNGDLVLAANASHHSITYSDSVHNRLRAYDNIPTSAGNIQPLSMLPFNKPQKTISGIIASTNNTKEAQSVASNVSNSSNNHNSVVTNNIPAVVNAANIPKSTPITISQLNSPPLIPTTISHNNTQKIAKPVGQPPGLISLHPGTNRPVAPLVNKPQSQKIKFPITKNWRPNLIPIDPTKKNSERKPGLVQVISGGKPYHISLEDYKKMCAIKKSFELKQKRLQEANNKSNNGTPKIAYNSVLKSMAPRKGLIISKTSACSTPVKSDESSENILEKLDKQVEKLESRLSENKSLLLPKIPKSLTVIPQTVTRKPSRPSSPILLITSKPKQITNNKS